MRELTHEDYLPPREKQFVGVGPICQLLQINFGQLRVLMDAAGVKFAAMLDGVPLLDANGVDAIDKKFREVQKEITDAVAKVEKAPLN